MIMAGSGSGPAPRWDHALIFDGWNNRLLLVGGRNDERVVRGDLWAFPLATYVWEPIDLSGPKARSGAATGVALDGSGFFYFGGATNDGVVGDLWWFDFATTTWQRIEPVVGPRPAARSGSRGAVDALGRFVVTHGGNANRLFDDTWAFDPSTRRWSDLTPASGPRPLARSDHELVSMPDRGILLLSGGCSGDAGPCPQGDLWLFDTWNSIWSEITPPIGPRPRTDAAMARIGETIVLVGGLSEIGPMADVWLGQLFGAEMIWTELTFYNHGPQGIYRRFGHDLAAWGNEVFVFGGEGVDGPLSDLWRFSPDRIPQQEQTGEYIEPT